MWFGVMPRVDGAIVGDGSCYSSVQSRTCRRRSCFIAAYGELLTVRTVAFRSRRSMPPGCGLLSEMVALLTVSTPECVCRRRFC